MIGIFLNPWDVSFGKERLKTKTPVVLYRKAVWYKANPRDEAYMKKIFMEKYPDGKFVDISTESQWEKILRDADDIVLLYPDSTGLGFRRLEEKMKEKKSIVIINGRKRKLDFTSHIKRKLYLKRILEWSMIGEVCYTLVFLLVTPVLLGIDILKGRR